MGGQTITKQKLLLNNHSLRPDLARGCFENNLLVSGCLVLLSPAT